MKRVAMHWHCRCNRFVPKHTPYRTTIILLILLYSVVPQEKSCKPDRTVEVPQSSIDLYRSLFIEL